MKTVANKYGFLYALNKSKGGEENEKRKDCTNLHWMMIEKNRLYMCMCSAPLILKVKNILKKYMILKIINI